MAGSVLAQHLVQENSKRSHARFGFRNSRIKGMPYREIHYFLLVVYPRRQPEFQRVEFLPFEIYAHVFEELGWARLAGSVKYPSVKPRSATHPIEGEQLPLQHSFARQGKRPARFAVSRFTWSEHPGKV